MNTVERITNLIKNKKITEKEFLLDLNLGLGTLSEWKSGKSKSYRTHASKIADYFNVSTDYILCKTEDPSPANKKDPPETENQEGQALYNTLVEIGAIKHGDEITDKQADALLEYFINNKDYIRFLLDNNK